MRVEGLFLPKRLTALLDAGLWPRNAAEADEQQITPIVLQERVRELAPDESEIYLLPPPFRTVQDLSRGGDDFWTSEVAAPTGISFAFAIPIADFSLRFDAPILLDYRYASKNPCLIRLQYPLATGSGRWVGLTQTFDEFANILKLSSAKFGQQ